VSICISVSAEGASDDSAGSEGASSRTSSSSSCGRGTAEASANSSGFRSKAVGAGIVVRILGGNRCVFFFDIEIQMWGLKNAINVHVPLS